MTNKSNAAAPAWLWFFFLADFLLVGAFIVLLWLNVPEGKLFQFFDLDEEANLPAWYSSMKLAGAGVLIAFYAWRREGSGRRRSYLVWMLAAILVLMSMDENTQIHEWVGDRLELLFARESWGAFFQLTRSWTLLVVVPFMVFLGWLLRRLTTTLSPPRGAMPVLLIGFILLIGSAEGIEMVGALVHGKGAWYTAEVCAEELGEMLGGTFLLWAGNIFAAQALNLTGPAGSPGPPPR